MSETTLAQNAFRSMSERRPDDASISLRKRFAACNIAVDVFASVNSCLDFKMLSSRSLFTSGIERKRSSTAFVRLSPPKVKRRFRISPARTLANPFVATGPGSIAERASLACLDLSCASRDATSESACRNSRPLRMRPVSTLVLCRLLLACSVAECWLPSALPNPLALADVAKSAGAPAESVPSLVASELFIRVEAAAAALAAAIRSVRSSLAASTPFLKANRRPSSSP
mmetsp:Transcript_11324/g.27164  ORF Transcript_11324/g.27164 Transcript_11324/m.27164 type:complete len:229 (-) Transcript_11324:844-1530(-)